MNLQLLYIDPGTGSALFSIAIGMAAAVYFLFRTVVLKLNILLFHRNKAHQSQYKYVIYAEDKRYWMFFKLILEEFEYRKIEVVYLTQSEDDPVFSSNFNFVKGKYIGKGNKAFAYLNFLSADIVLATTPDLDVLQWKRSKNTKHYCHLFHAIGGVSLYRLFALDYYDTVFLSGDGEMPEIRYLENIRNLPEKQLVVVGNSYFDKYNEVINDIPHENEHKFTVLVSPSWGPSALLKLYGERLLDPLVQTGWHIIIRPHPQSITREKSILDRLIERYKDKSNIEWDYNHENIYSLSKSDIMISDFSGIIYDYVFLFDRPVLMNIQNLDFRHLDAHYLKEEPFYIQSLRKIGLELDEANFDNIKNIITDISQNVDMQNSRHDVKEQMWKHQRESGKRIVDFMVETAN